MTNILLYSITICSSVVQICVSLSVFVLMILRRSSLHEQSTDFILYANTYIALFVIAVTLIDLSACSIHGQLFAQRSFDGWWCRTKACLLYMGGMGFFHSFALQAICRLCRILYPLQARLHSFRLYASLSGCLWVLIFLELLPSLLVGYVEYLSEDHHCQSSPSNISASATIISIGFFFPFSFTVGCYAWTLFRTRQRTATLTSINQRASIRRDLLILKRLVILLTVVTLVAVPHAAFPLVHLITGQLPSWSVALEWATTSSALLLISLVLPFVSPHLQKLWRRSVDTQPGATATFSVHQ